MSAPPPSSTPPSSTPPSWTPPSSTPPSSTPPSSTLTLSSPCFTQPPAIRCTSLLRRAGVVLLLLLGVGLVGCGGGMEISMAEARAWSAQRSWDVIENNDPTFFERVFKMMPADVAEAAKSADTSFAQEAQEAAQTTPPGGLEALLEQIRESFSPTITSATAGLTPGASGILVLGDFIGPDGMPLAENISQQVAVENFLDDLQTTPGIAGDWFIISLTPTQMEAVLAEAGAQPGQAVKVGIYEFIYDPANIYYMELLVSAEPYDPQHMVTYTGNARLSQVQTRTKVPGRGNGQVRFYYQPFAKEWLIYEEEVARRDEDAVEIEAARLAEEGDDDDEDEEDEDEDEEEDEDEQQEMDAAETVEE